MSAGQTAKPKTWLILVFGFLLMLFAGLIYSWSIFITPIEAELGFLRKETAFVFTISLSVSIFGQITAGILKKKTNALVVFSVPALLFLTGFFFASRIQSIMGLYVSYGVMVGFGIGMIYNAVLAYALDHFQEHLGVATGLLLMAFGMGGMILGTLAAKLMEYFSWRLVFSALGLFFSALSLAAAFLFKGSSLHTERKGQVGPEEVGPLEMVRSLPYILLFAWFVLTTSGDLIVIGHSALLAKDLGTPQQTAALIAGIISVSNGVSRIFLGKVYEIIKARKMRALLTLLSLGSAVCCLIGYTSRQLSLLAIGFVLAGVMNGGSAVLAGTYLKTRYGSLNFGVNLGITNMQIILASFLGNGIAGQIRTSTGSYQMALVLMLGFSLAALAIVLITTPLGSRAAFLNPEPKR
ncbi:MAG: MFS transporter [Anaerolineaceae bacterium]|nr:MFS transporter [Anaerolineaceae bacterium]